MDELLQGRTLGEQLGQPRLQHHVGQDGQQVVCPAVTTGAISHGGHRDWCPNTGLATGPTPALSPRALRGSCTHMAAVAWLRASRVPQYSSAHSQMPRRARTAAQGGCQARRHPQAPALHPQRRSPMHSSFLRGQLSSGIRRRSCTAEAYAGRPGPGGKRREASPMSAGLACRCRSMLRARAASRGCCTVLRARR